MSKVDKNEWIEKLLPAQTHHVMHMGDLIRLLMKNYTEQHFSTFEAMHAAAQELFALSKIHDGIKIAQFKAGDVIELPQKPRAINLPFGWRLVK